MTQQENITRIRVEYTKGPSLRFTGHLDMQRLWERLLRRTGLPIRYSQGFHPRARLNLASALPLGFISQSELLDFWMDQPRPLDEIHQKLADNAPAGLIIRLVQVIDLSEDALQVQMKASEFTVRFFENQSQDLLEQKVSEILSSEEIIRKRRKKTYDLRPLIIDLQAEPLEDGQVGLSMHLRAEEGATGRPDEVLDQMGYTNTEYIVSRTALTLENN